MHAYCNMTTDGRGWIVIQEFKYKLGTIDYEKGIGGLKKQSFGMDCQ